ncbi:hypothetical protein Q5P01_014046 [Channa striata]|uniref:G-protein coupled receptors family 1 profile domain-containing protein n=1 Tax=Channa striata TaxID=64152 RepID=A0AA88MLM2_CHASR|nr:hypothetical protein Q5P01_014046 [Channa striata]
MDYELCFPQLNASCRKERRPHIETVLLYILLLSLSLLTVMLNLLVITSISHFKQLHTPTNFLILSLAFSDFFVGLLMSFQILLTNGCWLLGDVICALYSVLGFIITSASVGTMVLISVDRYIAICDPLHYHTKVTVRAVIHCTCLCWACSVVYNSLIMKDNLKQPGSDNLKQPGMYNSCAGECVIVLNLIERVADVILTFIIPITVIIVLYMRVFVVVVSQARAMRSHVAPASLQHSHTLTAKKSELKAARTLGLVIVVFLLCIFPYFCVSLLDQHILLDTSSVAFVICLAYVNSCLNPMIYVFFYPWFRKSIRFIVTFDILKPGSSDTQML